MGFVGAKYTWKRGLCLKRLDRGLLNQEWGLQLKEAPVVHLLIFLFDHSPLLLVPEHVGTHQIIDKIFRYLAGTGGRKWDPFLSRNWRQEGNLMENLTDLAAEAKEWNQVKTFFLRKRRLGARLAGIQKAMESHSTRNLCKLEGEIRDELERVLTQEEMLWNRCRGVDWINFGDRNSSIFHQKWKSENKKIMINWLQQEEGIWCSKQLMMMMMRDEASLYF